MAEAAENASEQERVKREREQRAAAEAERERRRKEEELRRKKELEAMLKAAAPSKLLAAFPERAGKDKSADARGSKKAGPATSNGRSSGVEKKKSTSSSSSGIRAKRQDNGSSKSSKARLDPRTEFAMKCGRQAIKEASPPQSSSKTKLDPRTEFKLAARAKATISGIGSSKTKMDPRSEFDRERRGSTPREYSPSRKLSGGIVGAIGARAAEGDKIRRKDADISRSGTKTGARDRLAGAAGPMKGRDKPVSAISSAYKDDDERERSRRAKRELETGTAGGEPSKRLRVSDRDDYGRKGNGLRRASSPGGDSDVDELELGKEGISNMIWGIFGKDKRKYVIVRDI